MYLHFICWGRLLLMFEKPVVDWYGPLVLCTVATCIASTTKTTVIAPPPPIPKSFMSADRTMTSSLVKPVQTGFILINPISSDHVVLKYINFSLTRFLFYSCTLIHWQTSVYAHVPTHTHSHTHTYTFTHPYTHPRTSLHPPTCPISPPPALSHALSLSHECFPLMAKNFSPNCLKEDCSLKVRFQKVTVKLQTAKEMKQFYY